MGPEEENNVIHSGILDISERGLKKLPRAAHQIVLNITTLIIDDNDLERIDNLHTYTCLEKLSVQNNHLTRIFQVGKLSHLKILNLASNEIVAMEGLKECKLLTWLSLASNQIKNIESLSQNVHLEHLDLSGNLITTLSDLSYLRNLKTLLLHKNKIQCLSSLNVSPSTLSTLTLNDNSLSDLADLCHLSHLGALEQLTLAGNPCIAQPKESSLQFDYRPYVINWCVGLRQLDGVLVGAKESLKAEWLYSQSKGRFYVQGQMKELTEFLLSVCPLHPNENWEEDKKLNLILSKVQEHQMSLRSETEISGTFTNPSSPRATHRSINSIESPLSNRKSNSTHQSPEICHVRKTLRSPNFRLSSSPAYQLSLPPTLYGSHDESDDINGNMMTQSMMITPERKSHDDDIMTSSLDPSILGPMSTSLHISKNVWSTQRLSVTEHNVIRKCDSNDLYLQEISSDSSECSTSLPPYNRLQSKLKPVPEALNSPDVPDLSSSLNRHADLSSQKIPRYFTQSSKKPEPSEFYMKSRLNNIPSKVNSGLSRSLSMDRKKIQEKSSCDLKTKFEGESPRNRRNTPRSSKNTPNVTPSRSSSMSRSTSATIVISSKSQKSEKTYNDTTLPRNSIKTNGNIKKNSTDVKVDRKDDESATIIQKTWRGHLTRNKDEKVLELKNEIRNRRTEEYIRHLTKELASTKEALEQERKYRALQMDTIKVLWKEVQSLDCGKKSERRRPSGSSGSQISNRFSDKAIGKLMESLQGNSISESNVDEIHRINESSVQTLSETCHHLQVQVTELQGNYSNLLNLLSSFPLVESELKVRHQNEKDFRQESKSPSRPTSLSLPEIKLRSQENENNIIGSSQKAISISCEEEEEEEENGIFDEAGTTGDSQNSSLVETDSLEEQH